jgi:hypothetical protein
MCAWQPRRFNTVDIIFWISNSNSIRRGGLRSNACHLKSISSAAMVCGTRLMLSSLLYCCLMISTLLLYHCICNCSSEHIYTILIAIRHYSKHLDKALNTMATISSGLTTQQQQPTFCRNKIRTKLFMIAVLACSMYIAVPLLLHVAGSSSTFKTGHSSVHTISLHCLFLPYYMQFNNISNNSTACQSSR